MGVGVIGSAASTATEPLPFGAGALLTSGFVNGTTFNYTATVNPGRYVIQGATQDGASPIIAYAPNSNTTAVAYPGRSAILDVTASETVIKLSAIPLIGQSSGKGYTVPNNGQSRNIAGAENANGSIIVNSSVYYDGGTWRNWLFASNDSGNNWYQVLSTTGNSSSPKPVKFFPGDGGYFLAGLGDNWVWRSTDGINWSQRAGFGGSINDLYDDGNGVVYGAAAGGIYKSTDHGLNWTAVVSGNEIYGIARLQSNGQLIAVGNQRAYYSSTGDNGTWSQNQFTNNSNVQTNGMNITNGVAILKDRVLAATDVWPSSDLGGAGFTLIGPDGVIVNSSYQGEITQRGVNNNWDGPENYFVVLNRENRGFVLAIGVISGSLMFSTDGSSWSKIGILPGTTNRQRYSYDIQPPEINNGKLSVFTNQSGRFARYVNKFAYKIYASTI